MSHLYVDVVVNIENLKAFMLITWEYCEKNTMYYSRDSTRIDDETLKIILLEWIPGICFKCRIVAVNINYNISNCDNSSIL